MTKAKLVLLLLVFCPFFHFLQHHHALGPACIEIALRELFMHQVLMAINAGCALRFHLLVRGLG